MTTAIKPRKKSDHPVINLEWSLYEECIRLDAPMWWAACFGPSTKDPGKWYWKIHSADPCSGIATTWQEAVAEIKWRVLDDRLYPYNLPDETKQDGSLTQKLKRAKAWYKWRV